MTAAKKTVTKTKSAKKSSTSKAKKKPARKSSRKKASTSKKTVKKASAKKPVATKSAAKKKASSSKKATKKTTAKKVAVKKASSSKKTVKKASAKKSVAAKSVTKEKVSSSKKVAVKKAATKKAAVKKAATKKATHKKKSAQQSATKKSTTPRRNSEAQALSSVEIGLLEELDSVIDSDLLENFEGWGAPDEAAASESTPGCRADREADFDELLEGEKPVEDWNSTTVFESDKGTEKVLDKSAEKNVVSTSLVVVQESAVATAQGCRIEQPDPTEEQAFEEFAAEEIISILDESLALDLEAAAAQAEPKDEDPKPEARVVTTPEPSQCEDLVSDPEVRPARSGFLSRLWRMMISSDPD